VTIYKFVVKETIEEMIEKLAGNKKEISDKILEEGEFIDTNSSKSLQLKLLFENISPSSDEEEKEEKKKK
jgi:SNF2 family DNA or RNA helicase